MFSSTIILVYIVRCCCCRCIYPRSVLGAGIVGTLGAGAAESRERSLQLDGLQAVYIVLFLYTIPTVYIISYILKANGLGMGGRAISPLTHPSTPPTHAPIFIAPIPVTPIPTELMQSHCREPARNHNIKHYIHGPARTNPPDSRMSESRSRQSASKKYPQFQNSN